MNKIKLLLIIFTISNILNANNKILNIYIKKLRNSVIKNPYIKEYLNNKLISKKKKIQDIYSDKINNNNYLVIAEKNKDNINSYHTVFD